MRDSEAIREAASLQYLANSVRKFERGHRFYTPRESVPEWQATAPLIACCCRLLEEPGRLRLRLEFYRQRCALALPHDANLDEAAFGQSFRNGGEFTDRGDCLSIQ